MRFVLPIFNTKYFSHCFPIKIQATSRILYPQFTLGMLNTNLDFELIQKGKTPLPYFILPCVKGIELGHVDCYVDPSSLVDRELFLL